MPYNSTHISARRKVKNNTSCKNQGVKKPPKIILKENCEQNLLFNVLSKKNIKEQLIIKNYKIWDGAIEATFSRKYETDMEASPNHLIFISALINLQKMVYVYMHHFLEIEYKSDQKETLKVWPTNLNISIPKLYTKEKNIVHRLNVKSIRNVGRNKYFMDADTFIEDSLIISGKALIIKL